MGKEAEEVIGKVTGGDGERGWRRVEKR